LGGSAPAGYPIAEEVRSTSSRDDDNRRSAATVEVPTATDQRLDPTVRQQLLRDVLSRFALDPVTAPVGLATVVVPVLADWYSIDLFREGAVENIALYEPNLVKSGLVGQLLRHVADLDPGTAPPAPAELHEGRLYLREGTSLVSSRSDGELRVDLPEELDLSAIVVSPLRARDLTLGTLTLAAGAQRAPFAEADREFADDLAAQIATALDRARLAEMQAHASAGAEIGGPQLARLQAVTTGLSRAITRAEVARVLMREGLAALGAQAGSVVELQPGGREFVILDSSGYDASLTTRWARFDMSGSGPVTEAVSTGELVVVESPEELVDRWPSELAEPQLASGDRATLTAPLKLGADVLGALHIAFRAERRFKPEELEFVTTLARQCALGLERARLYENERDAREQAERLAGRLRRLQTVIDATFLTGSLDELLRELLGRLREAVEADTAAILILDETESELVVRESLGFTGKVEARTPVGSGFAGRIAAAQTSLVIEDLAASDISAGYLSEAGIVSLAGVPLTVEGRTMGVLHVGMKARRTFDREDLLLLRLVAARAAVVIDRAELHEREHRIAEILQRSLLPERLPAIQGLESAARYVPGAVGVAVGGDWYDVFELADGTLGVAIGDVVGHGVRAAAAMGRLRNVLRVYALEGFGAGKAFDRLNQLAFESREEIFATGVLALIEPSRTRIRLANAGHPPPLLLTSAGEVRLLEGGRSLPVGAAPDAVYTEVELAIEPGSTLVLYTDGLVERRSEPIDVGIRRLADIVEHATGSVDEIADTVVKELETSEHADDIALVVVRFEPATQRLSRRFPADTKELAPTRQALREWLSGHAAGEEDMFAILVAVNEACTNAIEHPIGRREGDVAVEAEIVEGTVSVVVEDTGTWKEAAPGLDRGHGLDFIQALMDAVEVRKTPSGTRVHMRRRLRRDGTGA
jgi:serine phosphatase RsbU (regulator of sigma subunit)/anti-sigma regulatory factor (Ser/Thr protein kinase)